MMKRRSFVQHPKARRRCRQCRLCRPVALLDRVPREIWMMRGACTVKKCIDAKTILFFAKVASYDCCRVSRAETVFLELGDVASGIHELEASNRSDWFPLACGKGSAVLLDNESPPILQSCRASRVRPLKECQESPANSKLFCVDAVDGT